MGSDHELYFYKKSWEIMTYKGLTKYNDEVSGVKVILRTSVLYLLFAEFSQYAFDKAVFASEDTETYKRKADSVTVIFGFDYIDNRLKFDVKID